MVEKAKQDEQGQGSRWSSRRHWSKEQKIEEAQVHPSKLENY